ncbi:MAG: DUF5615 family PIN-like protein [Thermoplasmata archaeon]
MATDAGHSEFEGPDPAPVGTANAPVASARWLADEMLGRLARYLRFLGHDTAYVRGLKDAEVVDLARRESRVLLTRDRALAHRVPGALLLTSPQLKEQFRAVRRAFPEVTFEVRFDRCTLCNGTLEPTRPPGKGDEALRAAASSDARPTFDCTECGHRYWEGSHTARVRRDIAQWIAEDVP